MKIKLDENMPASLISALAEHGHDVDSVPSEGLGGSDDECVWQAAQSSNMFLITQDLDFSDTRRFTPGTHQGVMIIRLRDPGRQAIFNRVDQIFRNENVNDWAGSFVVATEHKIRILRS